MNLEEIQALSRNVVENYDSLDTRPDWLKAVPSALDMREKYYLFLHVLLSARPRDYGLRNCLEIGTRMGTGSLHMAHALHERGYVTTIDIEPGCKPLVEGIAEAHGLNNLCAITSDSSRAVVNGMFDVLFIDGNHTLESAYGDYLRFRPQVKEGGLIIFDDTRINAGMTAAWDGITDPKIELRELHYMGFGVAIKSEASPAPEPLYIIAGRVQ